MPPVWPWFGRYNKQYPKEARQLPGGKLALIALMGFSLLILAGEIIQQLI